MHSPRSSSPRGGVNEEKEGNKGRQPGTGSKGNAFKEELRRRQQAQGKGKNLLQKSELLCMEEEDLLSARIGAFQRELIFKASIAAEVQRIKDVEEAARAERRAAAEARRAAVLERLRKIEEEQTRKQLEAQQREAVIAEGIEKERQKELNRIADDQYRIGHEDERSGLVEQSYREELERRQYNALQEEKLREWEEQQRLQDVEEEKNREKRAQELEEKKRKLAILREKYPDAAAKPAAGGDVAGGEGRLTRIRNKAIFKSKALAEQSPAAAAAALAASGMALVDAGQPAYLSGGGPDDDGEGDCEGGESIEAFVARITVLTSENDLRSLQSEMSASKRALRLEQRQISDKGELAALRKTIAVLGRKEAALSERLEGVAKAVGTLGDSASAVVDEGGGGGKQPPISVPASVKEEGIPSEAPPSRSGSHTNIADTSASSPASLPAPQMHVPSLTISVSSSQVSIPAPTITAASATPKVVSKTSSIVLAYRRVEVLLRDVASTSTNTSVDSIDRLIVECIELSKMVQTSNDPMAAGYASRLSTGLQKLKSDRALALTSPEPTPAPVSVPVPAAASAPMDDISAWDIGGGEEDREVGYHDSQEEVDEEYGDEDHEEELDLDSIEGWTECVETSMATAAHHAAYYGFSSVLEVILKFFDVSVVDEVGRTPLHYAALSNQLDCVVLLVTHNAAMVDMGDELGDTALHAAASSSEGGTVLEFLLSCECSPDIANYEGKTIAHVARTRHCLEIISAAGGMLYCVDILSRTPLYCAARDGNDDCIEYLMQQTPAEYQMWPEEKDGNSPLHIAAINGHERIVDLICSNITNIEDCSVVNKKQFTAAHVAANASILTKLYENGADLWVPDGKNRFPLYIHCFFGRADCAAFLLNSVQSRKNCVPLELMGAKDQKGDTVLHVSSLCGHIKCVTLLLYFLRNEPNVAGLTPDALAERAGHIRIKEIILHVEAQRSAGEESETVFNGRFTDISSTVVYYGNRWQKCFSAEHYSFYYYDRVGGSTTWEVPALYDQDEKEEKKMDAARDALIRFYTEYNADKLYDIDKIVEAYKGKYTELFVDLTSRYNVEDLSMFEGVYLDD